MVVVKICGFTNGEDARIACELGADMIGVIVGTPTSPRNVALERAIEILRVVPEAVEKVAVVAPNGPIEIRRITRKLKPDYLQIHSGLPAERFEQARRITRAKLIGVVGVPQRVEDPEEVFGRALEASEFVDYLLLDTKGPSGGGTGLTHDWRMSRMIRDAVSKPVFLAGGLNPANVRDAIKAVKPYGVDVSSGVESSPGKKDSALMGAFVEAAKGAF